VDLEPLQALLRIDHPHVLAHLGVVHHAPAITPTVGNPLPPCPSCVYVVTELPDLGSLQRLLLWRPALAPAQVAFIAGCVLRGLQCLHARGLPHGELHAGHVFMTSRGDVVVGGLLVGSLPEEARHHPAAGAEDAKSECSGDSEAKDDSKEDSPTTLPDKDRLIELGAGTLPPAAIPPLHSGDAAEACDPVLGDPAWLAPEASLDAAPTSAADIWAFGALLLQLVSGAAPLRVLDRLAQRATQKPARELRVVGSGFTFPASVADMARRCLDRDPAVRPSATELLRHPFLREYRQFQQPQFTAWLARFMDTSHQPHRRD
jgi:serine/threonine protein kinase